MESILSAPSAPYVAISAALACFSALLMLQIEHTRLIVRGLRTMPGRWGMQGRYLVGHVAALPLLGLILLMSNGAHGASRMLVYALILGLYLYVGHVLPRKPITNAQKERRLLRKQTPGFVNFLVVALKSGESNQRILERYIQRPSKRRAVLQHVVAEALHLTMTKHLMPFVAFALVARERGCQELIDVAEALAQTDERGTDCLTALKAHERTLAAILQDEFRRGLEKRKMLIMGLSAISLFVGVLGNILWIVTGGGSVLGRV